jgi:hypothetical protein
VYLFVFSPAMLAGSRVYVVLCRMLFWQCACQFLCVASAVLPVVADVMVRVANNLMPPAAPKYPAASVIQPELK